MLFDETGNALLDFAWLDVGAKRTPLDAACLPPEQNEEALDVRSDVFALGALLRVALLGRAPHAGQRETLGAFDAIIGEMTRPERDARPDSASVSALLEAFALDAAPGGFTQALPLDLQRTQLSAPPARRANYALPNALPLRRLVPGSMLGRFELLHKLGEGGMGEVFRAIERATGQQAALKVLRSDASAGPAQLQRFRKEARILREINTPYVANLIEINHDAGVDFIALEFVDGGDLADLLEARGGRLPEEEALAIVADIARGLAEAHARGIVHRDIKPQNVMIASAPPDQTARVTVKLCDFGIARALDRREGTLGFTEHGAVLGTPAYMAPEQCSGQLLSPATDVYALGVTLFLLVSGRLPFEASESTALLLAHTAEPAPGLCEVCSDVSEATARLVARMLQKAPAERFADAGALLEAIERLLRGDASGEDRVHPIKPTLVPARVVQHVFEWELEASAEALWPLVSNTDRLNRAVGLPPAHFERVQKALGVETFASNRVSGINLHWREHPFEWIEGRRWSVLRVFEKGVMHWFTVELELIPKPGGGTRLRYSMTLEPRHVLGRWIVALEMRLKQRPALGRAFARIDAYAKTKGVVAAGVDAFEAPAAISEKGRVALARGLAQLREAKLPEPTLDALRAFCERAPDQQIAQLRPLAFAQAHGLDPNQVVEACLRAAQHGLFVLLWQVICPLCRVPADFAATLRDLADHARCPSCNADFPLDLAQSLELVFRVSSAVRASELRTFCIGGPAFAPHVVAQLRLAPHEQLTLELALRPGALQAPQPTAAARHRAAGLARSPSAARQRYLQCQRARQRGAPAAAARRAVDQASQQAGPRDRRTRGAQCSPRGCVDRRARGVSGEFPPAVPWRGAGEWAAGSGRAHRVRGQLVARAAKHAARARRCSRVRTHPRLSARRGRSRRGAEGGALVKTASAMTLCAYESAAAAARAALALRERFAGSAADPLDVRIAVHQGPALTATMDGRLDYFGRTLETALDLIALAPAGQVLLSAGLADDQDVIADVISAGYAPHGQCDSAEQQRGPERCWPCCADVIDITSSALGRP